MRWALRASSLIERDSTDGHALFAVEDGDDALLVPQEDLLPGVAPAQHSHLLLGLELGHPLGELLFPGSPYLEDVQFSGLVATGQDVVAHGVIA